MLNTGVLLDHVLVLALPDLEVIKVLTLQSQNVALMYLESVPDIGI